MMQSLRNWFRNPRGRPAATPAARRPPTVCLRVEQLEERAVPTVNLLPYKFVTPGVGTFHATSENFATGAFKGVFTDAKTGINVAVTGKLTHLWGEWDTMTFQGNGSNLFEFEHVEFNGYLNEGQALDNVYPPHTQGFLTETVTWFDTLPPHSTTTVHYEWGAGQWI
jgi:hypothetical protein